MNGKDSEQIDWRDKLRAFSDSMFRNCQIVRKRWEISSFEKKRKLEIIRLGNLAYRLHRKKSLTPEELEKQIKRVEKIDAELKALEERLRDLIIKSDVPRQLTTGTECESGRSEQKSSELKAELEKKPEISSDKKLSAGAENKTSPPKTESVSKDSEKEPATIISSDSVRQAVEKVVTKATTNDTKKQDSGLQETAETPKPKSKQAKSGSVDRQSKRDKRPDQKLSEE
jgi:hypothetical protein